MRKGIKLMEEWRRDLEDIMDGKRAVIEGRQLLINERSESVNNKRQRAVKFTNSFG